MLRIPFDRGESKALGRSVRVTWLFSGNVGSTSLRAICIMPHSPSPEVLAEGHSKSEWPRVVCSCVLPGTPVFFHLSCKVPLPGGCCEGLWRPVLSGRRGTSPQGGGLALVGSLNLGVPLPQQKLNSGLQNKTYMPCSIHSLCPALTVAFPRWQIQPVLARNDHSSGPTGWFHLHKTYQSWGCFSLGRNSPHTAPMGPWNLCKPHARGCLHGPSVW